jgi:RNA polymerase sigma-70 factor (ECF subfamily)
MPDQNSQSLADFVGLLTRHQSDLQAFIISLMPGDPEVSDVLQKSNLVLWNKRGLFAEGSGFIPWAFAVARFEVLNHLKKQRRSRPVLLDENLFETLASEAPEEFDFHDRRLASLEICLCKLRPQDRELLEHRYRSGLSLQEYASRAMRSVSSLSVTLNRLRTILRRCVARRLATEGGLR